MNMSKTKIEITAINVLTQKRYKIPFGDECTICRNNLNEDSHTYQAKGLSSFVVIGECGHAFHQECLENWIKINPICPVCTLPWKFKEKDKK